MDNEKNTSVQDTEKNIKESAKAAETLTKLTQKMKEDGMDFDRYTHTFAKPFTYEGETHDKLSFDWTTLTGRDSLAIEAEIMMKKKKTVVNAAYSEDYLAGMAVRACTYRSEIGRRIDMDAMEAMPLTDILQICNHARYFLLASGL